MNKSILTLFAVVTLASVAALGADSTWSHVDPDDVWIGEWSDASNWDSGVPGDSTNDMANLTSTVGSYIVNMDHAAPGIGILTLSNAVGKTVTLNLNAEVDTDTSWAFLDMMQGAIVNVNGTYRLGLPDTGNLQGGKLVVNDGGYLHLNCRNKAGAQKSLHIRPGGEILIEEGGTLFWHWLKFISEGKGVQVRVRGLLTMNDASSSVIVGWACFANNPEMRIENNGVLQLENANSYILVSEAHSASGNGSGQITLTDNGTVTNRGRLFIARNAKTKSTRQSQGVVNIDGGQWYNDEWVQVGWDISDEGYANVNDNAEEFTKNTVGTLHQTDGLFRTWANVYVANGPSIGLLNLAGGHFYMTNDNHDATLYLSSAFSADDTLTAFGQATLRLDGGYLRADKIIGTQGDGLTTVEFMGGTVETGSTDLDLGKTLVIGDGIQAALLNLLGGGTHTFADDVTVNGNATLKGSGTISTPKLTIEGDGILAPGSSPGLLQLDNGDLEMKIGSIFEVEIGGLDAGTEHDVLEILNGSADLAGELRVKFVNGFDDDVSFIDTFDVLTASDGISGNFSNVDNGRVNVHGGRGSFEVDLSGGTVRLMSYVIPEPASTTMLLLGGLALMLRRRLRA